MAIADRHIRVFLHQVDQAIGHGDYKFDIGISLVEARQRWCQLIHAEGDAAQPTLPARQGIARRTAVESVGPSVDEQATRESDAIEQLPQSLHKVRGVAHKSGLAPVESARKDQRRGHSCPMHREVVGVLGSQQPSYGRDRIIERSGFARRAAARERLVPDREIRVTAALVEGCKPEIHVTQGTADGDVSDAELRGVTIDAANGASPCAAGRLQHWRGIPGILGLDASPVLEFLFLDDALSL